MKTVGLDIGDVWVGSALSDGVGISCRPYQTVKLHELDQFLLDLFVSESSIDTVVVGHPITVGGTKSQQTIRIEEMFAKLQERHPSVIWVLRDERFSTKRAISTMKEQKKKEKKGEHSIAAAFILQSYLDYKAQHLQGNK